VARIRAALAKLADALKLQHRLRARAQRRYKANRRRAFIAHNEKLRAMAKADRMRMGGHPRAERRAGREADRAHHRELANHHRAQHYLGVIKRKQRQIHKLKTRQSDLEAELKKLSKVTIKGNKAEGGTPGQRWKAVCLASVANCSSAKRRNFYSMAGTWDIDHVITPGEEYGERSDCSSTVTGWAKAAGLPDPNGTDWTGGYTGTLIREANGWKGVSESAMRKKGWGYVVYGSGTGHHTEAYIGPGNRTAGHGSAPVDFGVIDLFGTGPSGYQCFIYDPK